MKRVETVSFLDAGPKTSESSRCGGDGALVVKGGPAIPPPKPRDIRHYDIDMSRWPVVVITGPTDITLNVCAEYARVCEELVAHERPFALVSHSPRPITMDAVARKAIADFEKARNVALSHYMKALALTFPTRTLFVLAGLVTMLNPPPYPKKCFLDLDPAIDWASSVLESQSAATG